MSWRNKKFAAILTLGSNKEVSHGRRTVERTLPFGDRGGQTLPRPKGVQFSDAWILLVFCWAVLHDRPTYWACRSRHWPAETRGQPLPSPSTMSRRMRFLSVQQLLAGVLARLQTEPVLCRHIDSKPLPVGGFSKDRDARRGYATGGMARGYKLCCAWGRGEMPDAWCLGPLNLSDPKIGAQVLGQLSGGGYVLADANFDSNRLFEQAAAQGFQLVAPRKTPDTSLGHRTQSPWRLRSIQLLEGPDGFGRDLYRHREQIERCYGHLTSFGGGLQPLPSWVRRPHRVVAWVAVKLAINAVRIRLHKGVAA